MVNPQSQFKQEAEKRQKECAEMLSCIESGKTNEFVADHASLIKLLSGDTSVVAGNKNASNFFSKAITKLVFDKKDYSETESLTELITQLFIEDKGESFHGSPLKVFVHKLMYLHKSPKQFLF